MTQAAQPAALGHSVLVVPVPALEELVRGRHEHYDRDYLSADPSFAHAHVTILGPFVTPAQLTPAVRGALADIARDASPFAFRLAEVATFPNGIIHLVPEPDEAFRALTASVWRAFPHFPPYAGEFADVRPHVTIDAVSGGVSEQTVRDWVAPLVPVVARADRLLLSWYEPGACRTLADWPLGQRSSR